MQLLFAKAHHKIARKKGGHGDGLGDFPEI